MRRAPAWCKLNPDRPWPPIPLKQLSRRRLPSTGHLTPNGRSPSAVCVVAACSLPTARVRLCSGTSGPRCGVATGWPTCRGLGPSLPRSSGVGATAATKSCSRPPLSATRRTSMLGPSRAPVEIGAPGATVVLAPRFLRPRITQDSGIHKLVASAVLGQIHSVLSTLRRRLQVAVTSAANRVAIALREATRPLPLVAGFAMDLTRSRRELLAENTLLRQQLIVTSRKVKRPAFRPHERGLLVLLSRLVHNWRNAVLLVKPDTILRWHRESFVSSGAGSHASPASHSLASLPTSSSSFAAWPRAIGSGEPSESAARPRCAARSRLQRPGITTC